MDEYEDEYMDEEEFLEHMILNGYIEMVGIDRNAEPIYKMTRKMIDDFPAVFEEHLSLTNELVFSVWQKGLLEVFMTDDGEWTIKPNEKTFEVEMYQNDLSDEEYLLILEIIEISKRNGDKI